MHEAEQHDRHLRGERPHAVQRTKTSFSRYEIENLWCLAVKNSDMKACKPAGWKLPVQRFPSQFVYAPKITAFTQRSRSNTQPSCSQQLLPPPHVPQEYFDGDEVDHSSEPPSAKGLAVFRDPNAVNGIKRTATSINWHPDGPTKIAVSYRFVALSSRLLVRPAANKNFLVGLHQNSEWRGNPGRS